MAPGISPSVIEAFTTHYNVQLPMDMKLFYSLINGMPDELVYDDMFVRIFPFQSIRPVGQECDPWPDSQHDDKEESGIVPLDRLDAQSLFLFADHSIWLPAFAVRLAESNAHANNIYSIYRFDQTLFYRSKSPIFHSFADFLRTWLTDGDVVYGVDC